MSARSFGPLAPPTTASRYQVERKLGEGAAGAVYLARDRETGEQVALKKLFRMDAKSVLRLKREFRSLQALNHPHVVKLYDMGQAEDAWFLTMEYLDGCDLTTYLNDGPDSADAPMSARLLPAFRQLARGVQALHDAGMLHRDLKPSNVLVVGDRVVVLDFGLVRELSGTAATLTEDGSAAGTPAYMAPEQILAQPLTAASDWYALGVMLYESVSGLLPFDGPMMQLLRAKLESDAVPLAEVVSDVPGWLSELCVGLLRRAPAERPTGADVLARLDALPPSAARTPGNTDNLLSTEVTSPGAAQLLVGREAELERLWDAFSQAEAGSSVVVHVRAPSGTGKSVLVEHFLDAVERPGVSQRADALALRSRCYELEAMPFKALDGVIDALTRHLARLDDVVVAHLLPADVTSLARVFPVLERLGAVKRLLANSRVTLDAVQSRKRAEVALRTLLDKLAANAPLVIWIDDLQWGDLDSARILRHWCLSSSEAPILFVFSYRSDELATSSCLQKLLQQEPEQTAAAVTHTIDIAALDPADVRSLCEARLSANTPARAALIERVVSEAQGSPFFASQLLALAEAKRARGDTDLHSLSVDLIVAQTSAMLSDDAKKLLAVLAVAGRPMSPKLLLTAAAVQGGGRALVHDLRALNLVRTREIAGQRMLEVFHDRVRERVQHALSHEEDRLLHQRLFDTLEHSGEAEADWLHTLALGAGQDVKALLYGQTAAARATASLAFERAAGLYRRCVELAPAEIAGEVWSKLAAALARSGRGVEAAEASLEAAKHVPADERAAWLERAATHFLRCGHFAQGESLVRRALAAKDIDVPSSNAGLLAAIVWERARIKLRGTQDTVRSADCPTELLERHDLLSALAITTQSYDPLRAALFQARALRWALEAGEPTRLAATLARTATAAAMDGSLQAARDADALLARAAAINSRLSTPDPKPLCSARALSAFLLGRLGDVEEPAREAERLYRADAQDDPNGNYFARLGVASARLGTLMQFARYEELAAQLHGLMDEAVANDNRFLPLQLTYIQTRLEQATGKGAESRSRLDAQRGELPDGSFGVLHVLHVSALMSSACWTGDHASVREQVDAAWPRFLQSLTRRAATLAWVAYSEHGRYQLNQHVLERRQGEPFDVVRSDIQALKKFGDGLPDLFGSAMRGRVAWLKGDRREAVKQLRECVAVLETASMPHLLARERYALGVMLGGVEGAELRAASEPFYRALGLNVADDLRAYYPELREQA